MLGKVSTAMATPNIAFIKYWGKRDDRLVLPANSSLSMTLDRSLNTVTSALFSKELKEDALYINGSRQDLNEKDAKERFEVVNIMRRAVGTSASALIVSKNSFPTASGLASSASGIAAMIYAVSKALDLEMSQKDMSIVARRGSGSSCRSMFGGIVKWNRGVEFDGSDSYAEQVVDQKYWPELVDVIGIVTKEKKKISSRAGMKQTVETSTLYPLRIKSAERRVESAVEAIKNRDFHELAEIIMRDSNDMHATMLDTWPPIIYLNDVSRDVIYATLALNENESKNIAAYTFDAGPNPQIITTSRNLNKVKAMLSRIKGVQKVIVAKSGPGPAMLSGSKSLINARRLSPKR